MQDLIIKGPKNALYITLDGGKYSYSFLGSKQKGLYFTNQTKSQMGKNDFIRPTCFL